MATIRTPADEDLIQALRDGDERAFARVVDMYGASMIRIARLYVRDRAVAQEVVQETWVAMLRGIGRFEGRSSLRTWLFGILVNIAKTHGARESRSVPFSALQTDEASPSPSVPAERFAGQGATWAGHWTSPPRSWEAPLERVLSGEVRSAIEAGIHRLPPMQRRVLSLRDVEGWSAEEVCNVLELSETNQRVLLHRARSRLRELIDRDVMNPNH